MIGTADRIQVSPRLVSLLLLYHGGVGSGCYSVGSRLFSGSEVLRDDYEVARAISELRDRESWAKRTRSPGVDRETVLGETAELISWLEEHQDLMAHRRIGEVDIFIECEEPGAGGHNRYRYKCRVECLGPHGRVAWQTVIGEPTRNDVAVDSDEAYDRVARSALSFALHNPGDENEDEFPGEMERDAFLERGGWCYDEGGVELVVTRP